MSNQSTQDDGGDEANELTVKCYKVQPYPKTELPELKSLTILRSAENLRTCALAPMNEQRQF